MISMILMIMVMINMNDDNEMEIYMNDNDDLIMMIIVIIGIIQGCVVVSWYGGDNHLQIVSLNCQVKPLNFIALRCDVKSTSNSISHQLDQLASPPSPARPTVDIRCKAVVPLC